MVPARLVRVKYRKMRLGYVSFQIADYNLLKPHLKPRGSVAKEEDPVKAAD